jgi:hypothetical protein
MENTSARPAPSPRNVEAIKAMIEQQSTPLRNHDQWAFIDVAWYNAFIAYNNNDAGTDVGGGGVGGGGVVGGGGGGSGGGNRTPPGPIDNAALLPDLHVDTGNVATFNIAMPEGTGAAAAAITTITTSTPPSWPLRSSAHEMVILRYIRVGQNEHCDYRLIPLRAYAQLRAWYGGDDPIVRFVSTTKGGTNVNENLAVRIDMRCCECAASLCCDFNACDVSLMSLFPLSLRTLARISPYHCLASFVPTRFAHCISTPFKRMLCFFSLLLASHTSHLTPYHCIASHRRRHDSRAAPRRRCKQGCERRCRR